MEDAGSLVQNSNARTFYARDTILGTSKDWAVAASYGTRSGIDYAGPKRRLPHPSDYKWDSFSARLGFGLPKPLRRQLHPHRDRRPAPAGRCA